MVYTIDQIIISPFDTIPSCDGQTDRRTDRQTYERKINDIKLE